MSGIIQFKQKAIDHLKRSKSLADKKILNYILQHSKVQFGGGKKLVYQVGGGQVGGGFFSFLRKIGKGAFNFLRWAVKNKALSKGANLVSNIATLIPDPRAQKVAVASGTFGASAKQFGLGKRKVKYVILPQPNSYI